MSYFKSSLVAICTLFTQVLVADVIYVPDDHPNIQYAIDAAAVICTTNFV